MKFLFGFHEMLEVVTNGVSSLAHNATEVQRTTHKDLKKKDCKVAFCIQYVVDNANFDRTSHAESAKKVCDILYQIL